MGSVTQTTAAVDTQRSEGDMNSMRMAVTKIWKGDIVLITTDGYCLSNYDAGAAGDQFVGVAAETRDNRYLTEGDASSGAAAAGDRQCRIWVKGIFEFDCPEYTIETHLGLTAYVADGSVGADTPTKVTFTAPAAEPLICGTIVELIGTQTAATRCRVLITAFSAVGA